MNEINIVVTLPPLTHCLSGSLLSAAARLP